MTWVESSDVRFVVIAMEYRYVAVDGHNGIGSGIVEGSLSLIYSNNLLVGTAFDFYWRAIGGGIKAEFYFCSVFNGKGDIAAHILCLSRSEGKKPYEEGG